MPKLTRYSLRSLKAIQDVRKMIDTGRITRGLVVGLANAGEDIINKAYQRRDWANRTGNLHDSYVSAVFVNGVLVDGEKTIQIVGKSGKMESILLPSTIRFVDGGSQKAKRAIEVGTIGTKYYSGNPIQTTGHEEALEFLKAYKQRGRGKMDKVQLVIAAAMYYSGILESKGYTVLSNIEWDLIDLLRDGIYAEGLLTTSIPVDGMVHRLSVVDPRGTRFSFANVD